MTNWTNFYEFDHSEFQYYLLYFYRTYEFDNFQVNIPRMALILLLYLFKYYQCLRYSFLKKCLEFEFQMWRWCLSYKLTPSGYSHPYILLLVLILSVQSLIRFYSLMKCFVFFQSIRKGKSSPHFLFLLLYQCILW